MIVAPDHEIIFNDTAISVKTQPLCFCVCGPRQTVLLTKRAGEFYRLPGKEKRFELVVEAKTR
jgi:hypothetical protein